MVLSFHLDIILSLSDLSIWPNTIVGPVAVSYKSNLKATDMLRKGSV